VTTALAAHAGAILMNVAAFVFMLLVTLVGLFFFLKDSAAIGTAIRTLLPFEESRKAKLIAQARNLIYASAITMLTVASVQGLIGGILFAVLGMGAPVFWGLVMAICAFIPLVGTAIIWVPAVVWLFVHGFWIKGLLLAVGGVFLISGTDNVLRPLLMSGRTSMNVLLMLVSLLGGLAAFGFIGLLLGPVVEPVGAWQRPRFTRRGGLRGRWQCRLHIRLRHQPPSGRWLPPGIGRHHITSCQT
jgi:predicted PurR-regulated permease PerM